MYVCVLMCIKASVCKRENKYERLDGRAPEGTQQYGVTLQSPTDKLIHLLTPLTHLSDFVKLTIDHTHLLFLSFSLFPSPFPLSPSAGLFARLARLVIIIITPAACGSLVISDRGV